MGINLRELESRREPFSAKLKEKLPDVLFADDFVFTLDAPKTPDQCRQCWELGLTVWLDDETSVYITLGYMYSIGPIRNADLDVNEFFWKNTSVFLDLLEANSNGSLDDLAPLLSDVQECIEFDDDDEREFAGVVINLKSYSVGGSSWKRDVLKEDILIVHESEEEPGRILVECQQSERYDLRVEEDGGVKNYYQVPFDKVDILRAHKGI